MTFSRNIATFYFEDESIPLTGTAFVIILLKKIFFLKKDWYFKNLILSLCFHGDRVYRG
jgi:hypothetical protein